MADNQQTQQQGGLPSISANADANNLPLYGASDDDLNNLQQAQQKVSEALEHRYDNPNWFKVAAGFAKPQLGGFLASLGSASDAMGDNIEQQRNNVLSSSDLKLKLLQNQMILGANKRVSDQIKQWQTKHPGEVAPADQIAQWNQMSPGNPVAKQMQSALENQQKTQELTSNMQTTAQRNIQYALDHGLNVDPSLYTQAGLKPPGGSLPPTDSGSNSVSSPPANTSPASARGSEVDRIKDIVENGSSQPAPTSGQLESDIANVEKPKQKQVIDSSNRNFNPLYTQTDAKENLKASDADVEKSANTRLSKLLDTGDTPTYAQANNDITSMQKILHDNPSGVARVTAPVAKHSGVVGGILSSMQSGLGVGVGGFTGHIDLPVVDAITGTYEPKDKELYSTLNGLSGRVSRAQQNLSSVNPNAASNQELSLQGRSNVDPTTQLVPSMAYNLEYTRLNNDMAHEMAMTAQKLRNGTHDRYQLNPTSRTPSADILASPAMKEISDKYADRFKKLNDGFSSYLGK